MNVGLGSGGCLRGEAQTKSSSIANVYGMAVQHSSGFLRKKINTKKRFACIKLAAKFEWNFMFFSSHRPLLFSQNLL